MVGVNLSALSKIFGQNVAGMIDCFEMTKISLKNANILQTTRMHWPKDNTNGKMHTKDKKINVIFANKMAMYPFILFGFGTGRTCFHSGHLTLVVVCFGCKCQRKWRFFACLPIEFKLLLCIAREIRFSTIHLRALETRGKFKSFKIDLVPLNGMFVEFVFFFA